MLDKPEVLAGVTELPRFLPREFDTGLITYARDIIAATFENEIFNECYRELKKLYTF